MGRELLQAKQALPHGEFQRMVERELPFSRQTAWRYMSIASAEHLNKLRNAQLLPSSWYTLSILQGIDSSAFDKAVASGKINPEMTRAEAEALVMRSNTRRNLTSAQWATLAIEAEDIVRAIQGTRTIGRPPKSEAKSPQKVAEFSGNERETRQEVAKLFHTNKSYVSQAEKIKQTAPEVFEKVKAGTGWPDV